MGGGQLVGRVVSNRMQKTVVVAVDRLIWQSKYKVWQKRTSKIMAHDEKQECNIGDVVRITALYRQLSKHKSYTVSQLLQQVPVYDKNRAEQLASEWQTRESMTAEERVAEAAAAVEAAKKRLELLKEQKEKLLQDVGLDLRSAAEQLQATRRPAEAHASVAASPTNGQSSSSTSTRGLHTAAATHTSAEGNEGALTGLGIRTGIAPHAGGVYSWQERSTAGLHTGASHTCRGEGRSLELHTAGTPTPLAPARDRASTSGIRTCLAGGREASSGMADHGLAGPAAHAVHVCGVIAQDTADSTGLQATMFTSSRGSSVGWTHGGPSEVRDKDGNGLPH